MKNIGVFVCWCGANIATTVDVKKLVAEISKHPGVAFATEYKYLCSDPGQNIILDAIKERKLDRIVVAACSPTLHETTFRNAGKSAGLNPFLVEIANIREQCSWVHEDKEVATQKALKITRSIVEKVKENQELEPIKVPLTRRALVIGGGIAGIQTATDIANSGYEVLLVEKSPSIGGHMAQLSETFPTLDCSQCILTPKMVEVSHHPKIKLYTYCEVDEVSGYVGNFKVKIRKKAAYIDRDLCNGCGICIEKCPIRKVPSEFDEGLSKRRAIYIPFPQAVPNKPVIDREQCTYFKNKKCRVCEKFCEIKAIKLEQTDEIIEEEVGAIIVATGFQLMPKDTFSEYGHGKLPDVVTSLQFERLLSASGPTNGEVRRPSDGAVPRDIVFIQCVGSRDPEHGVAYCSKICCMYTAKHALMYKHKVHDGRPFVFYIDVRSGGKNYEEFVQKAMEEEKIVYLRGKVSRIYQDGKKIIVVGEDTILGRKVEIPADMVVLAYAMVAQKEAKELAQKLKIGIDENNLFSEAHPKLRPVESNSAGFFLAGAAHAPKDIPEAVAQASGSAAKVMALFSKEMIEHDPLIVGAEEALCSGCKLCIPVCPYHAREYQAEKKVVTVREVLCEGCGACAATCPSGAAQQRNLTDSQLIRMIGAISEASHV